MSDSKPNASSQYESFKKYPETYAEPTHKDWLAELAEAQEKHNLDCSVIAGNTSLIESLQQQLTKRNTELLAANALIVELRVVIDAIKEAVCGEYKNRWDSFQLVQLGRRCIADACDIALSKLPDLRAEEELVKDAGRYRARYRQLFPSGIKD